MTPPQVRVVIPYYRDRLGLARLLGALDLPQGVSFEVVVADDGSPEPPDPGRHAYPVRVVRQDDDGFRAAAARNLGARGCEAPVICFLDGDVVPAPGYLAALTAPYRQGRAELTVGRRRHADLSGWSARRVVDWLAGSDDEPALLPDPEWLGRGYAETHDLSRPDDASFRFVISAVLALSRELFEQLDGFDETFRGYGGEDWELAQRAYLAGARMRHVPDAVAWHDGPDLAGRSSDLVAVKNAETLLTATRLTHPLVRGTGLVHAIPDNAVRVDARGWTHAQLAATAESLLHAADAGLWVAGLDLGPLAHDPRLHVGRPPDDVLTRARVRADVTAPIALVDITLADLATRSELRLPSPDAGPAAPTQHLRLYRTRDLNRQARGGPPAPATTPCAVEFEALPRDDVLEHRRQSAWRRRMSSARD